MTKEEVAKIVKGFGKGTIHTVHYTKKLKTLKGVTDEIKKVSMTQGRFGVEYDHIQVVREGRNDCSLPAENAGLQPGMEWDEYPYFLKSKKTGDIQLRVSRANSGISETKYFKNGQEITKAEAKALCLKSEFPDYKDKPASPVFNISVQKIDNII